VLLNKEADRTLFAHHLLCLLII